MDLQLDGAALTAWLVDTPSVSGDEGPLADAIEAALRPLPHLTVHRDGNTIVARTTLGRPERVILAGHVDTVPVAGNLPSRLEGPRLYGCGTSDMKAGVAVQLRLAAGLTSPRRDVTYVFYDCEEVAADRNGLLRLSSNSPELLDGDFAVLMEPSSAEIEGGCQGTLRAEIVVSGQRAHTARSWMGYHTYPTVQPDKQAAAYVTSLFSAWPVRILDVADGARPGLGQPAAAEFAAAVGGTPRPKLGWTDVARFSALGIPAVNYGPGISEIAHTPGEYVEISKIAECEARLRAWLDGS